MLAYMRIRFWHFGHNRLTGPLQLERMSFNKHPVYVLSRYLPLRIVAVIKTRSILGALYSTIRKLVLNVIFPFIKLEYLYYALCVTLRSTSSPRVINLRPRRRFICQLYLSSTLSEPEIIDYVPIRKSKCTRCIASISSRRSYNSRVTLIYKVRATNGAAGHILSSRITKFVVREYKRDSQNDRETFRYEIRITQGRYLPSYRNENETRDNNRLDYARSCRARRI